MWIELLAGVAWAGSCCGTTTTALPTRVGERETIAVGAVVGGEFAYARWDSKTRLQGVAPAEQAATTTLGLGWRWAHWGQVQVALPMRWTWRSIEALHDSGGGPGDLSAGVVLDPFLEGHGPVPVLSLGVRMPTGRDWTDSSSPLLADVTGRPGFGVQAGLGLERQVGAVPWSVGLDFDGGPDAPAALGLSGSVGRAIGSDWSISGGLRHVATLAGDGTNRTTLSAQAVRGGHLGRAWGGLALDVPLPGLGRQQPLAVSLTFGGAWVR